MCSRDVLELMVNTAATPAGWLIKLPSDELKRISLKFQMTTRLRCCYRLHRYA